MIKKLHNTLLKKQSSYFIKRNQLSFRFSSFVYKSQEELSNLTEEQLNLYNKAYFEKVFEKPYNLEESLTIYQDNEALTKLRRIFASIMLGILTSASLLFFYLENSKSDVEKEFPYSKFLNEFNKKKFKKLEFLDIFFSGEKAKRYKSIAEEVPNENFWEVMCKVKRMKGEGFEDLKKRRRKILEEKLDKVKKEDEIVPGFGGIIFDNDDTSNVVFGGNGMSDEEILNLFEKNHDEIEEIHWSAKKLNSFISIMILISIMAFWNLRYGRLTSIRINMRKRRVYMSFHFGIEKDRISDLEFDNFKIRYDINLISSGNYSSEAGYEISRKDGERIVGIYKKIKQKAGYFDHDKMAYLEFLLNNSQRL